MADPVPLGRCLGSRLVLFSSQDQGGGVLITIEITAGLLVAFFWAFWIFAFGGWWCGGGC